MKKIFSIFAVSAALVAFASCSGTNESTTEEQAAETQAQTDEEVMQDLQDGQPVLVDVTGAEVTNGPDDTQQVQTEVTLTPEQAQ